MPKQAGSVVPALSKTERKSRKRLCTAAAHALTKLNRLTKKLRKTESKVTALVAPGALAKLTGGSGRVTRKKVAAVLFPS